jgi:uncharacterized protein (TIGR02996 family)
VNDHDDLVRAIRRNPAEKVPRLMYADWLDEHRSADPAAVATAEFIRVAAGPVRGPWPMPREAYKWLKANWKWLLPRTAALSIPITEPSDRWPEVPEGGMQATVKGGHLDTYVTLAGQTWRGEYKLYSCRLQVWFSLGLAYKHEMPSPFGRERVEPALRQDQPHLFVADAGVETLPLVSEVSDALRI